MPVAMPDCSSGTVETAASATTGLTMPIPAPPTRKPARSAVHCDPWSTPDMSTRPRPQKNRPRLSRTLLCTRPISEPAIGAMMNDAIVIGR